MESSLEAGKGWLKGQEIVGEVVYGIDLSEGLRCLGLGQKGLKVLGNNGRCRENTGNAGIGLGRSRIQEIVRVGYIGY